MPDSKISGLTSATTPLAGTEVLPIVQGGQTRQVSVANLTAGRSVDASTLTVTGNTFLATTSGNVGIGTTSPVSQFNMYNATNATATIQGDAIVTLAIERYSTNSIAPSFAMRKFRGTLAAPTAVATGDVIANLNFVAYGGTTQRVVSQVRSFVDTYVSDTDISSYLTFSTSPAGSAAATEQMRITSAGNVGIGTTSPAQKLEVFTSNATVAKFTRDLTTDVALTIGADNDGPIVATEGVNNLRLFTNATERMRIDSAGNVGIGTSSPSYKLDVVGEVRANNLFRTTDGTNIGLFGSSVFAANVIGVGSSNSAPLVLGTAATEQMRITAAGDVGIGTSSPGSKLEVVGAGVFKLDGAGSTTPLILRNNNTTSTQLVKIGFDSSGAIKASINAAVYGNDYMTFNVGSDTERMRIDASGNLGLGVTPSAWISAYRALDIGNTASVYGRTDSSIEAALVANAYRNSAGNWIYRLTDIAGKFGYDTVGSWAWYTAPSGTAGNTISFTQAMTLDASGRLLVGTTTAGIGNNNATALSVANGTATVYQSIRASGGEELYLYSAAGSVGLYSYTNHPLVFGTNNAERMRITSAGNVGIGTSSPGYSLDVAGSFRMYQSVAAGYVSPVFENSNATGYVQHIFNVGSNGANGQAAIGYAPGNFFAIGPTSNDTTTSIVFRNNNATERMRIDASGNVGIGVTPSAWAGYKPLQAGTGASFGGYAGDVLSFVGSNTYNDNTNWRYIVSGNAAARYQQSAGVHAWYTAPSGTAGNVISFTQAMTLDASGDLVIGSTTTNGIRLTAERNNPTRGIIAHLYNIASSGQTGSQLLFTQNGIANFVIGQPAGVNAFALWGGRNTAADGTEFMRVDASGNLGIGTSSPGYKLDVSGTGRFTSAVSIRSGANAYNILADTTNTANSGYYAAYNASGTRQGYMGYWDASGYSIAAESGNALLLWTGGSERMRIDSSGNVGIGVSTPSTYGKLVVWGGNAFIQSTTAGVGSKITLSDTNNAVSIESSPVGVATDMVFKTSALTRMNLDASGNLGLGVTPSAWSGVGPGILELKGNAYIASTTQVLSLVTNAYYNGTNWIYKTTAAANRYDTIFGEHRWYTAPSGTAGNAISFTQAMTLDASGNLLVGQTSSISGKLQVSGAGGMRVNEDGAGTKVVFLRSDFAGLGPSIQVSTADPLLFLTSNTERMRITSAGNIHTPAGATTMTNGFIYIPSAGGTPTGAATAITGTVPLYYNSSANTLYAYNSGWQTISGGLSLLSTNANGVVYLNSSSQATTSTNLTFDSSGSFSVGSGLVYSSNTTTTGSSLFSALTAIGYATAIQQYGSAATGTTDGLSNAGLGVLGFLNPAPGLVRTSGAYPLVFATNGTERMRITSAGELGIGTSTPSQKLHVNGGNIYVSNSVAGNAFCLIYNSNAAAGSYAGFGLWNDNGFSANSATINFYSSGSTTPNELRIIQGANAPMTFYTNNTERMRITAGGEFVVGATATVNSSRVYIKGTGTSSAAYAILVVDSAGDALFGARNDGAFSTGVASLSPYNRTTASAANVFVDSSGFLFRSTSSARYKTDIQNATHGLAELLTLRPVTFKSKGGDDTVYAGLIAEEVHEAGLTEFVEYNANGEPDAVYYSNMVSLLTKAIQEQQAIIESLTARITALESAN